MSKDKAQRLQLVAKPEEYFYELLNETLTKKSFKPRPETEVYLLNLLKQFMTTDALYARDAEGHLKDEPLALMVKEAIETPESNAQKLLFRQVGDVSLYTAGFFQDSLNRKIVDLDYYIDMGGAAYGQVARRAEEAVMRGLFEELAHRFAAFVDILAEISDRTSMKNEKNLLRMYDLWVRTKSERAEKALKEAGIIPNSATKKTVQ